MGVLKRLSLKGFGAGIGIGVDFKSITLGRGIYSNSLSTILSTLVLVYLEHSLLNILISGSTC